ncbi:unnamed protein product [Peniophora sp. CBMAI 1063]|nr:unnamed protein product [Peniophora sp. CBMAI 1063]
MQPRSAPFVLPLFIHAPAYVMGYLGALFIQDEETQAQDKAVFGLFCVSLAFPTVFVLLWAFLYYSPISASILLDLDIITGIVSRYPPEGFVHPSVGIALVLIQLLDAYMHMRRIQATWRVLLGFWALKPCEYSITTLQQYIITPSHPWVNKGPSTPVDAPKVEVTTSTMHICVLHEPLVKPRHARPRSSRVMRHVLRARAEAASALAAFFGTRALTGRTRLCICLPSSCVPRYCGDKDSVVWMIEAVYAASALESFDASQARTI